MSAADALLGLGGLGVSAWLVVAMFAALTLVVTVRPEPVCEPGRRALR
jgi:hypothetical protein